MFKAGRKISMAAMLTVIFVVMPAQAALEDPTRPPTVKAGTYVPSKKSGKPRWVLTSTLVSEQRRTAVINDRVVERGERVNGARVVSIKPSVVRLRVNGREITLMMLNKKIKKISQVATFKRHAK